jgi:hypothetical protein
MSELFEFAKSLTRAQAELVRAQAPSLLAVEPWTPEDTIHLGGRQYVATRFSLQEEEVLAVEAHAAFLDVCPNLVIRLAVQDYLRKNRNVFPEIDRALAKKERYPEVAE